MKNHHPNPFYLKINILKEDYNMKKTKSRDGTSIAYWSSGSGDPLLLIHGTTADHHRWDSIKPRFEQNFTVHAMDRRGRGESGDSNNYHFSMEVDDIKAVVEDINKPSYVLGHSYGALCSLEASLLTDKIKKLILYEPPIPVGLPMYPEYVPGMMQSLIQQGKKEEALILFFKEAVKMPEDEFVAYRKLDMWKKRVQIAHTVLREIIIDKEYEFIPEKFNHMTTPTLLLLGGDSPPLFTNAIELLNKTIPNSNVVVMPNQQHVAMDMDPDLFIKKVTEFLNK